MLGSIAIRAKVKNNLQLMLSFSFHNEIVHAQLFSATNLISCSFHVFVAIFKIYCLSLNWLLLCCISQIIVVFHVFMLSIEANATSYREMRMRVWSNELLTLLFTL